jgi:type I restriction enzyme S subunit
MIAEKLRKAILQAVMQGKLTEQLPEDGDARDLLAEIQQKKQRKIKAGEIKATKPLPPIDPEEVPYEIPENWVWTRLGEIGEIVGGGTPKSTNPEYWDSGTIEWITPADMKLNPGMFISGGTRRITKLGLERSSAHLLPAGSIVYSSRAPIGYIAITKNPLATNQGFKSIKFIRDDIAIYLYYALIARTPEIIKMGSGTTFLEISGSIFNQVQFPLPPIAEQQRIVTTLEYLLPLIDKLEEVEKELETLEKEFPEKLKKSILQAAMQGKLTEQLSEDGDARELLAEIQQEKKRKIKANEIKAAKPLPPIDLDEIPYEIPPNWVWTRLGSAVEITMGQSPSGNSVNTTNGIEFHQGKIHFGNKIIRESTYKCTQPKKEAKPGSVLLCVRAPVGIVNLTDRHICIGRGLASLHGFTKIDSLYLFYYLQTRTSYFETQATGSTFKAISLGIITNSLLAIPPLDEQQRIVRTLEKLLPLCEGLRQP